MIRPTLVSAPASPIVSLADLKDHCRAVDFDDDDALLQGFELAAVALLDGWGGLLGRCLVSQTWRAGFAGWDALRCMPMPFGDTLSVAVTYFDADNVEQTVSGTLYSVVETEQGTVVRFTDSFTSPTLYSDRADPVRVAQTCGFATSDAVPKPLVMAIKMMVAHWYENREAVVVGASAEEFPFGVAMLIAPYRRVGF
ncbi:MAG: head-tail connector protein [Hyphomicrobiales bacterium]